MTNDPNLVSAEKMAAESPETFDLLPVSDRRSLKPGDFAKLCFDHKERMWVEVLSRRIEGWRLIYEGILTNHPVVVPLRFGDQITFGPEHVYDMDQT